MKIKAFLILHSMSLAICLTLQSQTVTNMVLDSPPMPAPAPTQTIFVKNGYKIPPQDAAWLKSQGWTDEEIASAIPVQNIGETQDTYNRLTNYYHTAHFNDYQIGLLKIVVPTSPKDQTSTISIVRPITYSQGRVIPPEDLKYFRAQGYSDAQIQASYQLPQPQQATLSPANQSTVSATPRSDWTPQEIEELKTRGIDPNTVHPSIQQANVAVAATPTPPDLKGAMVWMDSFLGTTNAVIAADVISMKPEALKFQLFGKDWNYSGHYTVMLNTPRKHTKPYFGLGSPETAKILILENVGGDTFPLQNATIWEKSNGFIDAVALDKEWIYSGTYTIQN